MRQLKILVGLSGSGKTTYRNNYIKEHPGTIVLCRDSLREAITGLSAAEYNQNPNEMVEATITDIITQSMSIWRAVGKKDLIIDQTNLRFKYIKPFIDFIQYHTDLIERDLILIDTPLDVCKSRVAERDGYINTDYIDKQHQQLTELRKNIIFDKIINYEGIC
jgi:predicted kinase